MRAAALLAVLLALAAGFQRAAALERAVCYTTNWCAYNHSESCAAGSELPERRPPPCRPPPPPPALAHFSFSIGAAQPPHDLQCTESISMELITPSLAAQYRSGSVGGTPCRWTPQQLDPNLCTHINYAFAFMNPGRHGVAALAGCRREESLCLLDDPALSTSHGLPVPFACCMLLTDCLVNCTVPSYGLPLMQTSRSSRWSGTTRASCTARRWR